MKKAEYGFEKQESVSKPTLQAALNTKRSLDNNTVGLAGELLLKDPLTERLKALYRSQDKLPKLIDDEHIKEQSLSEYYIKMQVLLKEDMEAGKRAAAHDEVVGEKAPIELENMFKPIEDKRKGVKAEEKATDRVDGEEDEKIEDKEAEVQPADDVSKILLVGGAGVGKTTLLHYMSYKWAKDGLWGDKFDYVFRVKLKVLLNETWASEYRREEKRQDFLSCFIDYCLKLQDMELPRSSRLNINLQEILSIRDKDRVLLLLDGYDEVAELAGNKDKVWYGGIIEQIFEFKHVIMSSRPNALGKEIAKKFERKVENKGLELEGILKYVSINYKDNLKLGAELKSFIIANGQVKEICEIPINTALICLVWNDPKIREKLGGTSELSMDQLYHEVIIWLGKRYIEKFKDKKVLNIEDKQVFMMEETEFLRKVAYDAFIKTGKLVPSEIVKENLGNPKFSNIKLHKVIKYGLLRPEADGRNLINQNHQFIHLTFQEYLTAYRLKEQLSEESLKRETAIFIASHRNEPKYLMTLKFLAGIVSREQEEKGVPLVTRFWEAVSCNVEGILELGLETKVVLFMHLLAQSKVSRAIDEKIPNLKVMQELIDRVVLKDVCAWGDQIIASGYLSREIVTALTEIVYSINSEGKQSQKEKITIIDKKQIMTALEVMTSLMGKGEFGTKIDLYNRFIELVKSKDWQLQKLGLERMIQIMDETLSQDKEKLKESLFKAFKLILPLIIDKDLRGDASDLIEKFFSLELNPLERMIDHIKYIMENKKYTLELKKEIILTLFQGVKGNPEQVLQGLELLKIVIQAPRANEKLKEAAYRSLLKVIKLIPEQELQGLELLKGVIQGLKASEWFEKTSYKSLSEIIKLVPEQALQGLELLKGVMQDPEASKWFKEAAYRSLSEIIKLIPEQALQGLELLKGVMQDPEADRYLKEAAYRSLPKVIKLVPALQGLELLKGVMQDPEANWYLKGSALWSLSEMIKLVPALQGLELLKGLIQDPKANWKLKKAAYESLPEVIKLIPDQALQGFKLLKGVMQDPKADLKGAVLRSLKEVIKMVPKPQALQVFELLKGLIQDPEAHWDLKKVAYESLAEVIKFVPALQGLELLKGAMQDPKANQYLKEAAYRSLPEVIKLIPDQALQGFELLKRVMQDPKADRYLKEAALKSLSEMIKLVPDQALQGLELLKGVMHPKAGWYLKEAALKSLSEMIKLVPDQALQVLDWIKGVMQDPEAGWELKKDASKNLQEVIKLVPALQGLEWIKGVMQDPEAGWELKEAVYRSLPEVIKLVPDQALQGFELLKRVMQDPKANWKLKKDAYESLPEVIKLIPDQALQGFELLKGVKQDSNAGWFLIVAAIGSLLEVIKLIPDQALQGFEWIKGVMQDLEKDHGADHEDNWDLKEAALKSLPEVIKLVPDQALQGFELLKGIIQDPEADWDLKKAAYKSLPEVIKLVPALQGFEWIKGVMQDPKADRYLKKAAYESLPEVIKLVPDQVLQGFELLKGIIQDPEADRYLKKAAYESLPEVIKLVPDQALQGFELLKGIIQDPEAEADLYLKEAALGSLPEVIELFSLEVLSNLLSDNIREIRTESIKAVKAKLKDSDKSISYNEILSLINVIDKSKNLGELDLNELAKGAFLKLAYTIDEEGIAWLNRHFKELPHSNEMKAFLKSVCHNSLADGKLSIVEGQFLVKCIVEYGLTAVIIPKDIKVIFEDTSYIIIDGADILEEIVSEILQDSNDILAKQYREHEPMFKNSGSALPIAPSDVKDGSMVDGVELQIDKWHVSLMHLSNHKKADPVKVFILLERREETGNHLVRKMYIKEGNVEVEVYSLTPQEINTGFRESIFGNMEYYREVVKYYGSTYDITKTQGEELSKKVKEFPSTEVGKDYSILRKLLAEFIGTDEGVRELNLPWQEYVEKVRVFDRTEVLKKSAHAFRKGTADIEALEKQEVHDKMFEIQDKKLKIHGKQIVEIKKSLGLLESVIEKLYEKVEGDTSVSKPEKAEMKKKIQNVSTSIKKIANKRPDESDVVEELVKDMKNLLIKDDINIKVSLNDLGKKIKDIEEKLKTTAGPKALVADEAVSTKLKDTKVELEQKKVSTLVKHEEYLKASNDLTLQVKAKIQARVLDNLQELAGKGKWSSLFSSKKAVQDYLKDNFLKKELGKLDSKENVKIAKSLCLEAINLGIMSSTKKDFTCAKNFVKAHAELTQKIGNNHPEYFVDKVIVEQCISEPKLKAAIIKKLTDNKTDNNSITKLSKTTGIELKEVPDNLLFKGEQKEQQAPVDYSDMPELETLEDHIIGGIILSDLNDLI